MATNKSKKAGTAAERAMRLALRQGSVRAREFEAQGISRATLARLCQRGQLIRVSHGLYMAPDAPVTEHHTLVEAQAVVPGGVICLLSALQFHGLTTQLPSQVWMAIEERAWRPRRAYPPVRLVFMTSRMLEYGIETHELERVAVRITSPAKTVADCFKYRNKVGIDVAVEALRDYRRKRTDTLEALRKAAEVDRVAEVIKPYVEAIL